MGFDKDPKKPEDPAKPVPSVSMEDEEVTAAADAERRRLVEQRGRKGTQLIDYGKAYQSKQTYGASS